MYRSPFRFSILPAALGVCLSGCLVDTHRHPPPTTPPPLPAETAEGPTEPSTAKPAETAEQKPKPAPAEVGQAQLETAETVEAAAAAKPAVKEEK